VSRSASDIEQALATPDPEARRLAVQAIPRAAEGASAARLVVLALGDDDWRVRKEAVEIAAALEPRADVVRVLERALDEKVNIGLRNAAVEALVAMGGDAVPAAIAALGRLDADGRKLAVEILAGVPDPRGTEALARTLSDADANVRVAAAEALGNAALAGEEARAAAIGPLTRALASGDVILKLASLESLSRLGAEPPWSVLAPYVDQPLLRRHALAAAAGSPERAAIVALSLALGDGSSTVVRQAMLALAERAFGQPAEAEVVRAARSALEGGAREAARSRARAAIEGDEDPRVRAAAITTLGVIAEGVDVPLLVDALGEDELSERADHALRLFGEGIGGALLRAAGTGPASRRASILSLAASITGLRTEELRRAVRAALVDPAHEVVTAAIEALASGGDAADLEGLAPLVVNPDPRLAFAAAKSIDALAAAHPAEARALFLRLDAVHDALLGSVLLGALGRASKVEPDDVPFLLRVLTNPDARTRRAAVDALAYAQQGASADAVAFALADEEREVQLAAVRALGRLGRVEPLTSVVRDARDPELVAASLRALGDADPERGFEAARPLVVDAPAGVACAAVEALGRLRRRPRSAAPPRESELEDAIISALLHSDPEVVKVALSELAFEPDARALSRIGLCLDHEAWEVRRLAAELLGQNKTPAAKSLLRARYEREKDPVVRSAIATAVTVRPPPADVDDAGPGREKG
jgi:HEAT repeat protein